MNENKEKPDLLARLNSYISIMAPHQRERRGGQLMIEAAKEIKELRETIKNLQDLNMINPKPKEYGEPWTEPLAGYYASNTDKL